MREFLVKCSWSSTSYTLKVWALDEAHALKRASKNKYARTAHNFKVIGVRS